MSDKFATVPAENAAVATVGPAGATVRLQLHGQYALIIDGRRCEDRLPGRRGRLLLAYLACDRRAVERTTLLRVLWCPAELGNGAVNTFTALVSKVRSAIEPLELCGRQSLRLVLPAGSVVDALVAEAAAHAADTAAARRDWRAQWTASLSTLFVTQRPFLPDLNGAWVEERREQVRRTHRRALSRYAEACLRLGASELASAERSARELVRFDPLAETGYCLLMRALAGQGDRAAALTVYEELRRRLREELGISPADEAQAIYHELL